MNARCGVMIMVDDDGWMIVLGWFGTLEGREGFVYFVAG
jgi:hypothetical protein